MSAGIIVTAEQRGRERALMRAALLDGAMVVIGLLISVLGGSLTFLAETLRGGLATLIDLVSLAVIRRLHRGSLVGFDFGTGKIEQLCSLGVAAALGIGALWIGYDSVQLMVSERSDASPLGLALAAVAGALNVCLNIVAWDDVRRAMHGRSSAIMRSQLRSRWTKLVSSLTVLVTMTLAAIAKDPMLASFADAVGALLVCRVMAQASWQIFAEALPDLLDRSIDPVTRPALQQAVAVLPAGFRLADFRSRGTARAFALEILLACIPAADVAAIADAERLLVAELHRLLPDIDMSVAVRITAEERLQNPTQAVVGQA